MKYQIEVVAKGYRHSLAILESGKLYSWGVNNEGQLGDGTTKSKDTPQLIDIIPGKVVSIAAGALHSLALLESGEVYSWGGNVNGQVGNGPAKGRKSSQLVDALPWESG